VTFPITPLDLGGAVACSVARLDLLHPVVSGNKLFKLRYYLSSGGPVVTFGGPYSNHLVATAYACFQRGISCIGIVRGEKPADLSPTLSDCLAYGMELRFVSRAEYRIAMAGEYPGSVVIPEGGAGPLGVRGTSLILRDAPACTHVITAVGTGTTLQGLDAALLPGQQAIGIPVIAVPPASRLSFDGSLGLSASSSLVHGYAFGGYGRHTPELIRFMNEFHARFGIPLDFVYTAKAAFALSKLVVNGYFAPGSRVLFLHTGGLQGNRSLPSSALEF
jgi:1-aminocyclopropane-1-carboxylate deaminase